MDEIEKLIAAGESILRERHSICDEVSHLAEANRNSSVNTDSNSCTNISKQSTLDSSNNVTNDWHNNSTRHSSGVSLQFEHSKCDEPPKENSFDGIMLLIKEEFAKTFSVGLSVNSSLINANRLVTAVVKRFCKDASTSQQILSEVQQCEDSCKNNANTFTKLASEMHHLLAEMNNLSIEQDDRSVIINQAEKKVFSLRDMIAALISDTGFKDIASQIISPRTGLADLIEDSHLGLTLLSGELPNHVAKYQNEVLEKNQLQELHLRKEYKKLQIEFDEISTCMQRETTTLQIQIEKLNKDIDTLKYQLNVLETEKATLEQKFEAELKDAESVAAKLREEMVTVKQNADREVFLASKTCQEAAQNEEVLQSKVTSISEQLALKEDELRNCLDEKTMEMKSLKNYSKKLETDLIKEKSQIVRVEDVRKEFVDKIRQLENSSQDANKQWQSAKDEIQLLKTQSKKTKEDHAAEIMEIQEKLSDISSTLCDKHSEIRSRDVKIMQLQTDLQLEEQKSYLMNYESDLLHKQIDRLQNRIEKLIENRPKSEQAVVLHTDGPYNTLERNPDSHSEKIHVEMQKLLSQKDEEMKKLQNSLSSEILQKNNELERLSKFVERLEGQMVDVASALSLSNGVAEASTKVASHLKNHSASLVGLQQSSAKLHNDMHRISREQSETESSSSSCEHLKGQIVNWRSSTQKARDEARAARLELAKEKQKNSYLQIDLESARSVIERSERLQSFRSLRSSDDLSKSDEQTSADSISTVLGISDVSNHSSKITM